MGKCDATPTDSPFKAKVINKGRRAAARNTWSIPRFSKAAPYGGAKLRRIEVRSGLKVAMTDC